MNSSWRAVLIDGFTQSSKTWKCFEVLSNKLTHATDTLVLFVTQANSSGSVTQVIHRAQSNAAICGVIPRANIVKSSHAPTADGGNRMVVDYWHSSTKKAMLKHVNASSAKWKEIVIAIDETEQGGEKGVKDRLSFVSDVECAAAQGVAIKLVLVTATVANLSKSIAKIAASGDGGCGGLVNEIVHSPVVEHHFVEPLDGYVGPSWFSTAKCMDGTPVWTPLAFPKRAKDTNPKDHQQSKDALVYSAIQDMADEAKELSLVVTSVKVDDHKGMVAELLGNCGYNVVVELNCTNDKNYLVHFRDARFGQLCTWAIPYTAIEALADDGALDAFRTSERKMARSGITHRSHVTLPHMLQAALFMGTDAEVRIKATTSLDEFNKLEAISNALFNTVPRSRQRPPGYPEHAPRVALVAGHIAGRGITIQNPFAAFVCTSFVFVDTKDKAQRGATNAQRFGRACGLLKEAFAGGRMPKLIATREIMLDAIANEEALREKASRVVNGELVSLKDLIPKKEWDKVVKSAQDRLAVKKQDPQQQQPVVDNSADTKTNRLIEEYMKLSDGGKRAFTFKDINKNEVCKAINKGNNRGIHKALVDRGIINRIDDRTFVFVGINV